MQVHFEEAKQLLMAACQLVHPDPNSPIALTTDASSHAIGGVLEQFNNGKWEPLGFWSKSLKDDKAKWSTFRRELYAIQQSLRHFSTETQGRHLVIFTDHKPIVGAFKAPNSQTYDQVAYNKIQEIAQYTSDVRFVEG